MEPEEARSWGAQALLHRGRKTTASLTPQTELREGAPPGRSPLSQRLSSKPYFVWCFFFLFAVYLFKHLQLPGAGGLLESRVRTEVAVCICFLPPHLSAGESQHGSSFSAPEGQARGPYLLQGEEGRTQFGSVKCPPATGVSPLAGTIVPGLSFLCKPEPIK